MKKMIWILLIATLSLNAAVYIVPKEYDNVYNSIRSKTTEVITGSNSTLSATRAFGGENVKFRCVKVDKIPCRSGTHPTVTGAITDIMLLDPSEKTLPVYGYRIIAENSGSEWKVCGAAISGYTWDKSELTSTKDAGGNTHIKYEYVPNANSKKYLFFTTSPNSGSSKSHMILDIQQKCIQ